MPLKRTLVLKMLIMRFLVRKLRLNCWPKCSMFNFVHVCLAFDMWLTAFPSLEQWRHVSFQSSCKRPTSWRWVGAQWVEWLWNRRVDNWVIRSSFRSFARTAHSFACSALLATLVRFAALIRSLARSLTHSGAHGKEVYELNVSISYSFNPLCGAPFRQAFVSDAHYVQSSMFVCCNLNLAIPFSTTCCFVKIRLLVCSLSMYCGSQGCFYYYFFFVFFLFLFMFLFLFFFFFFFNFSFFYVLHLLLLLLLLLLRLFLFLLLLPLHPLLFLRLLLLLLLFYFLGTRFWNFFFRDISDSSFFR